jgi:hypothetical protein
MIRDACVHGIAAPDARTPTTWAQPQPKGRSIAALCVEKNRGPSSVM